MKRGFLNTSRASSEKQAPQPPETSSTLPAPASSSISRMDAKARLTSFLYRAVSGQGGPAPFSKEFFHEMVTTANEAAGVSKSAKDVEEIVGLMEERLTNKAPGGTKEAFEPLDLKVCEFDASKVDYGEHSLVVTTVPQPPNDFDLDPDGHCQWIVNGPTKNKVVLAPGYPAAVPKPSERKITIRKTEDMGVGLVATKDLEMGELIFAERPILAMPAGIRRLSHPKSEEATDQKSDVALAMLEWEQMLRDVVDRMPPVDRNVFLRLRNSHKEDGSGPLSGIVRTNGFLLDGIFDGPEEEKDKSNIYTGVVKIGSYINHSCKPNIRGDFSTTSFSMQFYAMFDIKAGQELFISYCDLDMTVAERRKKLAPYGFTCHCDACDNATKETDKLRQDFQSKTDRLLRALNWQRREGKKVPQTTIDPLIKLKNAMAKEGLSFRHEYKSIIVILSKVFEELGQEKMAKEYKEEGKRYKLSKESLAKYGF